MSAFSFNRVKEFNEAFPPFKEMDRNEIAKLTTKLLTEETKELCDEIWNWAQTGNISPNLLKEDADLLYVLEFARIRVAYADTFYKLNKLKKAFKRVHQSNMSKLGLDGKPIYREDGKVLKGPNYQPPDLSDLV